MEAASAMMVRCAVGQNEMNVFRNLWWFVLCTLLFARACVLANSGCVFSDVVAKVEKTEKGNLLLRRPDLLIYLHPSDFDTFSPHVGRWVKVPQFYAENKTDKPPESIKPGDVFSAPGARLIQVLPDPPLRISVHLTKDHYEIGESITVDIQLQNTTSEAVKLHTRASDDPKFRTRVPIIISVKKVGKWHKPRFYNILYSEHDPLFLAANQLVVEKHIDITQLIDGPGRYRVSAVYHWQFSVFSRLVDLTVSSEPEFSTPSKTTTESTSGEEDLGILRTELREAWNTWDAWTYFSDWNRSPTTRQRFYDFWKHNGVPMPQVWLLFADEREKSLLKANEHFSVTPELAREFAEFYSKRPGGEESTNQAFSEFEKVLWNRTIKYFKEFLTRHPQSVFAPEINFRMAEVVQRDPALRADRKAQIQAATVYMKRAVEGHGDKFSYQARGARATLANWSASLESLLRHYEWQTNLIERGTEADIYPIRKVRHFIKGYAMQVPKDSLPTMLKSMKQNLTISVAATIATIIRRASLPELDQIIKMYPDTELARKAGDLEYVLHNRTPRELRDLIGNYPETKLAELAQKKLKHRKD